MRKNQRIHRWISMVLVFAMVITLFPANTFAAEGETIKGNVETIRVNTGALDGRENNLNKEWKFYLGDNSSASNKNFDDSSWNDVDLPHDFSIIQSFTTSGEAESGFLPGGTGWYRKQIVLDEDYAGKSILLNFDGVYSDAYVYVNGTFVGEHHYGYTSFAFDITDKLVCDGVTENVIAVKAENNIPTSRWYSGSGIYRDVTMIVTDPVHVDLNGTKVTTPNIASGNGTVDVAVDVVNDSSASVSATVINSIYEKGGDVLLATASSTVTVTAGETSTTTSSPVVNNPELWSVENPNMYTVVTEVKVDGKVVDTYETDFGFRWFEFDSSGFHLNGKAVKLNGVCLHHDQGALGSAAYYDAMYRQLSIMKDMGCNAIRTSHNPADEQFIEICSELGLLVIEEAFDGLVDPKNYNSNDFSVYFEGDVDTKLYGAASDMICAEYAARSMVKRDRNQPSVFAWSFGNEIQEGTVGTTQIARYDEICADFITWINDEDGTRPVTSGDNNRGGSQDLVNVIDTITNAGGIAGFNYARSASELYSLAQNYGGTKGVIIASETASATNSRGQYENQNNNSDSDGKYHLTSYDTSAVSWGMTAHDSIYNTYQYDCVAGEFVWTGFDYLGEPTPWNGTTSGDGGRGKIPNSSYFGIVETTGFEKDTYYLYRSQWNKDATTVHLVTAWDADNQYTTGGKTPVWLYSNAPKVKLYLDGNLIGTATRNEVTSAAGHTYYTYVPMSNNSNVCDAIDGSGADSLYAVFNVAYTSGTLSTKAYDENDKEITLTDASGQHTVTTPETVTKLDATVNKTKIAADGSSLAYVEVDILDENDNLDTTATNNITFTLSGNGEIVGVDNGDQATTNKYQQSTVLTSATSANINAYAGKALVIVKSTEDAGKINLSVASSGLTGKEVEITTVASDNAGSNTGLVSYQMIKNYTIKEGTVPTFDTAATGTMADGSTVNGTIVWDEVAADVYNTAGDYSVTGTLTFTGQEPMKVSASLHVIANIIDLRNVSAVTMEGVAPTLPNTVKGVRANGELAGEFTVEWNAIAASEYDTAGEIVTVTGTAVIFGEETMDVTCTVRVAEAVNTESTNVAPMANSLTQDIPEEMWSDNLASITNGVLKPGDVTSQRWSNWNYRSTSPNATITLTWATAQMLESVNIYYYYDSQGSQYPESIEFSYSLNGQDYTIIGATAEEVETYDLGAHYKYTFDSPINPVGLKVKFTQTNGVIALTELEAMTYAAGIETNTSADLSAIKLDGTAIDGFAADTLAYEVEAGTVTAEAAANAGITILPAYEGVVRILTISEDGSATKVYEITQPVDDVCKHTNTEKRGVVAATCTTEGYTGDTYCNDCNTTIETGVVLLATGHKWNAGEITKEPTESEDGIKTFTCTKCGETKTEVVEYVKELKVPEVSVSVTTKSNGKIAITGQVEDYGNLGEYWTITSHGVLYVNTTRIGNRVVTTNTRGRTRVNFSEYRDDGSFTYNLKPNAEDTKYTMRAFVIYKNAITGKSYVEYSDVVRGSYETLK